MTNHIITKPRKSNIELLRLLAMLFILMLHSNYDGILKNYDGNSYTLETFFRFSVESIAIVGVNCFILISGYFGMKLKLRGVINLVFQTYFFALLALCVCFFIYGFYVPKAIVVRSLFPVTNYIWFLPCYLLLMLFSPILNKWLLASSLKHVFCITLCLYAVTFYWGLWGLNTGFGGYSFGHFVVMYVIGHMIRRYQECHQTQHKYLYLSLYLGCVLALMVISFLQFYYIPYFRSLLWSYNCPLIVVGSIGLFMFFACINMRANRIVNHCAKSCFAILLVHISPCSTYVQWLRDISNTFSGVCMYVCMYNCDLLHFAHSPRPNQTILLG